MQYAEESLFAGWFALVKRRWMAALVTFVVVFTTVALLVLFARPIYRADSRLRIGEPPPSPGVSAGGASIFGFMRMGGDPFANDLELLGSRTVAEAVVRDAALTARVIAPRGWHRDSLFSSFTTRDSTTKARFEARWLASGTIAITQLSPREQRIATVPAGQPVTIDGLDVVFRERKPNGPEKIQISTIPFGEAARRTGARIGVTRTRRDANVVQLVYTEADPAVARAVIASAVNRFVELRTRIQKRESGQNIDSLRAVARQTHRELTRAEAEMEALQRETRLVEPEIQSEAFVTRYAEVETRHEETRSHLRAIESVLERAATAETAGERWSKLLSYPAFRENEAIGQMLAQINNLEQQRRVLAPRRTVNNIEYKLILDQIAYMDRSLSAMASDLRTTLQEEVAEQTRLLDSMDTRLAGIPRQAIELARRQRTTKVLSEVMVLTESRLRQEELRQALSFANIQVIDAPALRYKPVWPRKKLGLAVGWLLATFCALLALVVSERADRRVRNARSVMRITDAPVLGVAVRTRDGLRFTSQELGAVVQHASANGRGPMRIVLAPVGEARGADLAAALRGALPSPAVHGVHDLREAEVHQSANLIDFASASAAAATQVPVAFVIEAGRTTAADLTRATALLQQAGGRLGGTIVVCDDARRAGDVWSWH